MADEVRSPESRPSDSARDFEEAYASMTPSWDIGRPQSAFVRLAGSGGLAGRVLDVGCGTGEHALLASTLGHEAVGIDFASTAIELAKAKATDRGVQVRFLVADALRLVELGERFDTVVDCGLFHGLDDDDRALFVQSLSFAVPAGGLYYMLCFSERQPGDWGPRRVTRDEIRVSFAEGWQIESIVPARIELTWDQAGARAWQVAAIRI
jgi:SAM-dependent methyltransferase